MYALYGKRSYFEASSSLARELVATFDTFGLAMKYVSSVHTSSSIAPFKEESLLSDYDSYEITPLFPKTPHNPTPLISEG